MRLTTDFSIETTEALDDKVLEKKKKVCQSTEQNSDSKTKVEKQIFLDKQGLREFLPTRPGLQEILKEVLQALRK